MIHQIAEKNGFSHYLKTKIIATVGPSCCSEEMLRQMILSGMSVVRLNFSHGFHGEHLLVIQLIRKLSKELNIPVAILQDLCGPKIRLGAMPAPMTLQKDQEIKISVRNPGNGDLYSDFLELPRVIRPGDPLLLDDGYIELKALEVSSDFVLCRVIVPGVAKSKKGINLPSLTEPIPVFTEKDRFDLAFGLEHEVDMAAMSFVKSADDLFPLQEMMKEADWEIPIIAKVERPAALGNIDGIINAFDGIMIARGDLGVELPPEEVPIIQKKLIRMAVEKNKFVITATQMLESMIQNPRPTRAEASDVSNAILDGSDAIMLSGETASGKYPLEAVKMMRRIALTTENSELYPYAPERYKANFGNTEAIVKSAVELAKDLKADCIMVFTETGRSALILSHYRSQYPVFAFTPHMHINSRMAAYWGVSPHFLPFTPERDKMIQSGVEHLKNEKLINSGDLVVLVGGERWMKGGTNLVKVFRVF